jgi:hypothetical protein
VTLVGDPVQDVLSTFPEVTSATLHAEHNHVRFTCRNLDGEGAVLVFDYLHEEWTTWELRRADGTLVSFVGSAVHDGSWYAVEEDGTLWKYDEGSYLDDDRYYSLDVRSGWFQGAQMSGWQRIYDVVSLLVLESACDVRAELFTDFQDVADSEDVFTAAELDEKTDQSRGLRLELSVAQQKCSAIQWRLRDVEPDQATSGQGFRYVGAALEFGVKPGSVRLASQQRK